MTSLIVPQADEIITSSQLPEPARVIVAYPEGAGVRIKAVLVDSNQFYDRHFGPGEFAVRRVEFTADGERFRLAALAERIRAAAPRRSIRCRTRSTRSTTTCCARRASASSWPTIRGRARRSWPGCC